MAHFYAPSEMKKKPYVQLSELCTDRREYNSIMQKIARNLHKPHSSIITIVLLVKEIIIIKYIRISGMWLRLRYLLTYLKTKGMQIKDVQKDVEQP